MIFYLRSTSIYGSQSARWLRSCGSQLYVTGTHIRYEHHSHNHHYHVHSGPYVDTVIYQHDLRIAIANVLDAFVTLDSSKILEKIKLHLLVHAPEDVDRFGPLLGMCTEVFESFNGTFRYASINSNHQAPSRDIAIHLADQESLRHRLTGGTWVDNGELHRAGSKVLDFLLENPNMQHLVGWCPPEHPATGSYRLAAIAPHTSTRPTIMLRDVTEAQTALNSTSYNLDTVYILCKHIISQAEDTCTAGSWVCAQSPIQVCKYFCDFLIPHLTL